MAATKTPEGQVLSQSLGAFRRTVTRSQRRFTPYRRAVTSRKKTVPQQVKVHTFKSPSSKISAGGGASVQKSVLEELTNKTWRLYRASPLFDLSYGPAHLKHYGRALALYIETESRKGTAFGAEATGTKIVEFTSNTSLRTSSVDNNSVRIIVKNKERDAKGRETILLTAYLCCTDIKEDVTNSITKEFTFLPLVLIKGSVFLTKTLISFLQKRYDCVIRDMTFTTTDMHWMFAINAAFLPEKLEKKPAELVYSMGNAIRGINKITFSIDSKHCQQLIKSACGDDNADLSQVQKDRFILALEQHFKAHFTLNLNTLKLERVATAVSVLGAEGRLKLFSAEHVMQVLSYLTTLCCEHFEKVTGMIT